MASVPGNLTSSSGPQDPGFLNDIVTLLWPNIRVAGGRMIKDIAEPMFAKMLPAPLNTLVFEKVDLGVVPMRFANVLVNKPETGGIKLDLDVDWDSECDVELDAHMMPKIGVEHIKLRGRLSILLCPLTGVIPLIGAAQVAFINPPYLKLTYTDAAHIANVPFIDKNIRKVVLSIVSSMAVLPNRFLIKLDAANNFFRSYQHPVGVLRLTVESGRELGQDKQGKGFLGRLVHDEPDCYAAVRVSAEAQWQTRAVANSRHPAWEETHDFVVSDLDQDVTVDVNDDDTARADDDIGLGATTVRNLVLRHGGRQELALEHDEQPTAGRIRVRGRLLRFVADAASLAGAAAETGEMHDATVGLLTVLVASARGVHGPRREVRPSVRVNWREHAFRTCVKTDAPGVDMENPSFDQAFRVVLKAGMVPGPPVRIALLDGEAESGAVEVPLEDVLDADELALEKSFDMGHGATVRAAVVLRGTAPA